MILSSSRTAKWQICRIHKLGYSLTNEDIASIFDNTVFRDTVLNALDIVINAIFEKDNEDKHRKEQKSRFEHIITHEVDFNAFMYTPNANTTICEKDTEDAAIPYYYAVVDAKSFGKFLIPTYKKDDVSINF